MRFPTPDPPATGLAASDEITSASDSEGVTAAVQRSFFSPDPVAMGGEASTADPAERVFFPCNREDALLLLAGLCISAHFPDPSVRLAVDGEALALVNDGLRRQEEALLCGDRPELFPVLIEIRPEHLFDARSALEHSHVIRLIFRKDEDANAFRYRSVDEFDAETFPYAVDKTCFDLEGVSRFQLRADTESEAIETARWIDRVLAGLHCMLSLGSVEPSCWNSIEGFLASGRDGERSAEPDTLAALCAAYKEGAIETGNSLINVILRVFAKADDPGSRHLLDAISAEVSLQEISNRESRWLETVRDVMNNTKALSGSFLSDEKSVFLRGALLAMITSSTSSLTAFLRAEPPSGPKVTSIAAFLVGLKQGLLDMPWEEKGPQSRELSAATAWLIRTLPWTRGSIQQYVEIIHEEDTDTILTLVKLGNIQLAEWTTPVSGRGRGIWLHERGHAGSRLAEQPSEYDSTLTLPTGRSLEIVWHRLDSLSFPVLIWRPEKGQNILAIGKGGIGKRALSAAHHKGGRLWYPREEDSGQWVLCCELPSIPAPSDLTILQAALDRAVEFYFPPQDMKSDRGKKTRDAPPGT